MYIFRTALNSYEQDNNTFQRIRSGSISGEAANNSSPPSSPISPSTITNFLQLWPSSTTAATNAIPTNTSKTTTTTTTNVNNPETATIPSLQRRASESGSQIPYKLVLLRRNTLPSYMSPFAGSLNSAEKNNHSPPAGYWEEDSVQVAMKTVQFGI